MSKFIVKELNTIEYGEAWDLQEDLLKSAIDKKLNFPDNLIENHLLLCEHPHVYTLGKSGNAQHLLVDSKSLQEKGISFYQTNRGGDITYHGPGQLVVYPVLDLEQFFTDLRKYMRYLEEAVILTLAEYGIKGDRLEGSTGVWLDPEDPFKARKICALGVRCSRWVTIHGLALNINTDLSYFDHIVPCGISNKGVTSMQKELDQKINEEEVKKILVEKFGKVFNAKLVRPEKLQQKSDLKQAL